MLGRRPRALRPVSLRCLLLDSRGARRGMEPIAVGSPTELIPEGSDEELEDEPALKVEENCDARDECPSGTGGLGGEEGRAMSVDATGGSPSRGKRLRDDPANVGGRPRRVDPSGHHPEALASDGGVGGRPVTSDEIQRLLEMHLGPIAATWKEMTGRVSALEQSSGQLKKDRENLHGRLDRVEKREATVEKKVEELAKEVEGLKARGGAHGAPGANDNQKLDPWAEYRSKHGPPPGMPAHSGGADRGLPRQVDPGQGAQDELSDEDKRTLIVGGWAQDSKKQTILDESMGFLARDDVKDKIDQKELIVWGPRSSFGVLKFQLRDGESHKEVRDRMWGVIQSARSTPYRLDSTTALGATKNLWCSFTKTREARRRSAHGSMIRRVCLSMVGDAAASNEAHNPGALAEGVYEIDWGSGTVWMGEFKLGSAAHRQPKNDSTKLMTSGWIDFSAVARATGVAYDIALAAFEREL